MTAAVSRRRFLAATSAAAAAGAAWFDVRHFLAAAGAAENGKGPAADLYGGLPMGIQSYTLRNFKVDQAIRHVEGLGLHYIEFFSAHYPLNADADQVARMNALLAKPQIKPTAHGVNGFSKDHAANRRVFEFAKRAGIKTITADPAPDSFDSLDKLVAEFDVRIAIHNHGPGARYDKLASVQKAVAGHHKLIGACVDTGHTLRSDEDPVKWIHELGPRVFALHIKDVAERKAQTHDVVIGTKHLDLVGMFKAMKKVKFPADGSISLEYESNPANPIDDVRQCLIAAREAIAKAAG
jgi:sugar phosphate isomerase/epimerase